MVLAISVDGLGSAALRDLGPAGAPGLWRLIASGASTLNARTAFEQTVTLPNHTGMLTGRRISALGGGHGWTVNIDTGRTVADPSGRSIPSIYDVVDAAGGTGVLFTSKDKFEVFERTWPTIDEFVYDGDNGSLTDKALQTLRLTRPSFTFLHLAAPDVAGHAAGWDSQRYRDAVTEVDAAVSRIVRARERSERLSRRLVIVLTADHGGIGRNHVDPNAPANYTIPFIVSGPGVPPGSDLYDLDAGRRDPGDRRVPYTGAQPFRNADVANLAATLLSLDAVPGSEFGTDQTLLPTPAA